MKRILFTVVAILLALQQVFTATDEEIQTAYDELEAVVNETQTALQGAATNYSNEFLRFLAIERLRGKLELQSLVRNVTNEIQVVLDSVSAFPDVNVTWCSEGFSNPQNVSDEIFYTMEECLYENKYETGVNGVNARLSDIQRIAAEYLICANSAYTEALGDPDKGDKFLEEIELLKQEVPRNLNLLGVNMLNGLRVLPVRCTDDAINEYKTFVNDVLVQVQSCVASEISYSVVPVCQFNFK